MELAYFNLQNGSEEVERAKKISKQQGLQLSNKMISKQQGLQLSNKMISKQQGLQLSNKMISKQQGLQLSNKMISKQQAHKECQLHSMQLVKGHQLNRLAT